MRGSVHGPGGKLVMEFLEVLHFLTILNSMKRKIKVAMKVQEKGL
jgi:hypothetical protein